MKRQLVWGGELTAGGRCVRLRRLVSEGGGGGVSEEIGAGEERGMRAGGMGKEKRGKELEGWTAWRAVDTSSTLTRSLPCET